MVVVAKRMKKEVKDEVGSEKDWITKGTKALRVRLEKDLEIEQKKSFEYHLWIFLLSASTNNKEM